MNYMFDLKYAWRLLIKSWGHSLLCVLVVGLSLGLSLWSYALIYSQALKPMGFPGSDRWFSVQIAEDATTKAAARVDAYTFQEIRKGVTDADYLGAYATRNALLSEGQESVSLRASAITPRLFAATKAKPQLGRMFNDADAEPGAAPVVMLSHDTWKNYFAADPAIVGKQARIDARPVQIVGVMPEGFFAFQDFAVWMPLQQTPLIGPSDSADVLTPMIALRDGQDVEALTKSMQTVVSTVNKAHPALFKADRSVELIKGRLMFNHSSITIISVIALLAQAVLLLGCVNISLVFLARFLERSRELALRTALGASRGRLMRQSLLETMLIVLLGLLLGWVLARFGVEWTRGISNFTSQILARGRSGNQLSLDGGDLLVALAVAVVVWLLSTLMPASRIAKQDAAIALAGTGKGAAVRGSAKGAAILVGLQVLVSSLVLMICGNLVLAIQQEAAKPTGLDSAGVTVSVFPTEFDDRYPTGTERQRYWDDLRASVGEKLRGAEIGYASTVPSSPADVAVAVESQQAATNQGEQTLPVMAVSENYFDLLGIRLRSGRLLDSTDNASTNAVAVIDEKTAQRFWPGQNAIGKRIQLTPADNGPWLTVVGVVSKVTGQLYAPDTGIVYRSIRQAAPKEFHAVVRHDGTGDHRVALRAAAYAVDRDLPLHNLQKLDDYMTVASSRFKSISSVFLAITLITGLLAATGMFGLISRSVAQRTQEVGIRRALGATKRESVSMFLRQGAIYLGVAVLGMGLGVVVTAMISSIVTNALDSVVPVAIGVFALMSLVIFAASYLPTRRAVALEPGDALRYE